VGGEQMHNISGGIYDIVGWDPRGSSVITLDDPIIQIANAILQVLAL